jgi:hypothetical protein
MHELEIEMSLSVEIAWNGLLVVKLSYLVCFVVTPLFSMLAGNKSCSNSATPLAGTI